MLQLEEVIAPKRGGYDLSFLDQLGDLENASPTALPSRLANCGVNDVNDVPIIGT